MQKREAQRFDRLYTRFLKALQLQGYSQSTIDAYTLAVRRVSQYFDRCPDKRLTSEDLSQYFADLLKTHSWSTIKRDRKGLQRYWELILELDWDWVLIVKPPMVKTLPDILNVDEINQLFKQFTKPQYAVLCFVMYTLGLRIGEAINLQVGDIDRARNRVYVRLREPHLQKYGHRLLPSHLRALDAMTACKKRCGTFSCRCPSCQHRQHHTLSCGHRSCPRCQNSAATQWLERQKQKLIPTEYFMVTFTLPAQLRGFAFVHQHRVYTLLFDAAIETLKTLGLDKRHLGGDMGMTAVLHTHTRRLDYHPHLHVVVPAAALADKGKTFKRSDSPFFIRGEVIAKMFRGKLLSALYEECFDLPGNIPDKWVVNAQHIGKGLPALQYLSRYLYRGVISEKAIIKSNRDTVTFQYQDSETKTMQRRTLAGEDFIWKLLTHVLPRRFRRVRDYGFLHHRAKNKLTFIRYLLGLKMLPIHQIEKPPIRCQRCSLPTNIVRIDPKRIPINFAFMKRPKLE